MSSETGANGEKVDQCKIGKCQDECKGADKVEMWKYL